MVQWQKQNKIRPGAYVNFESNKVTATGIDGNQISAVLIGGAWDGTASEFELVNHKTDLVAKFGKNLDELKEVRETLKGTGEVLVYNALFGKGTEAVGTELDTNITAVKKGSAGNNIHVIFTKNTDETFDVVTTFFGETVDEAKDLSSETYENDYVRIEAFPTGDATVGLKGGTDKEISNKDYEEFLLKLDTQDFKTVALPVTDSTLHNLLKSYVKEWRDSGRSVIGVTADFTADYEGIVSVANGVTLKNGEVLTAKDTVYFASGLYAGAGIESNTYKTYPDAVDCERKTNKETEDLILKGQLVFTYKNGKVIIETDINTLISFTEKKNRQFRKNRLIRIQDIINDNIHFIFDEYFIGKVTNDETGQESFIEQVITNVLDPLKTQRAVEYEAEELTVEFGNDSDSILVTIPVYLRDAMEKAYITVICK